MNNFWEDLPRPFFVLAPMEAVTDVIFRHVVARAGAPDIWFSEFTNATGWVHAGQKAIGGRLIKTDDEQPIVAQIWGGEPGDMEQLAAHCRELGFHGIDINMGCPAKSAIKSGGSALIRNPTLAAKAIAAAKTAGLPVSVKTRLGYTHIDEWREWLAHLLWQDIVNLTIHLRTKKEMSKVPAHFELIPEIIALRDEIAPGTLLTINGDVRDRAHGLELVRQYPGIDGIMIGRGVFADPFCFAADTVSLTAAPPTISSESNVTDYVGNRVIDSSERLASGSPSADSDRPAQSSEQSAARDSDTESRSEAVLSDLSGESADMRKAELINLLHYHLTLYDQYAPQTNRPFETLKRFFKIYIRDFDGAKELRDQLMHTKSTDEVRALLETA